MDDFRARFEVEWSSKRSTALNIVDSAVPPAAFSDPVSLLDLLRETDERLAKPEEVTGTIGTLFDGLRARLESEAFADYYETIAAESANFDDAGSRSFMIRVLSQQKRSDNFVTATITREHKRKNRLATLTASFAMGLYDDDEVVEHWDLQLNMSLKRAQLTVTLTPYFMALQKIKLVVTCAPSLERCFVFELATGHPRTDFQTFDYEGAELTRRWYKQDWGEDVEWLVEKIVSKLSETVKSQLSEAQERLSIP